MNDLGDRLLFAIHGDDCFAFCCVRQLVYSLGCSYVRCIGEVTYTVSGLVANRNALIQCLMVKCQCILGTNSCDEYTEAK